MIKKLLLVLSMIGLFMVGNVFAGDTSFTPYYDKDPQCFMTFIFCSGNRCVSTPDNEVWIVDSYGGEVGRNYYQEDGSLWRERAMKNQNILPYNPPTGCPPGWICPPLIIETVEAVAAVAPVDAKVFVVYFDFDKSNIRSDQISTLEEALVYAKEYGTGAILSAYCDFRGTVPYNDILGMKRVTSVENWFTSNGVEASFIETYNFGETASPERPLENGVFCKDCWTDRRVEIVIEH
jgi:outer membrane protein OmpA-like peptidoglycan-associated protein